MCPKDGALSSTAPPDTTSTCRHFNCRHAYCQECTQCIQDQEFGIGMDLCICAQAIRGPDRPPWYLHLNSIPPDTGADSAKSKNCGKLVDESMLAQSPPPSSPIDPVPEQQYLYMIERLKLEEATPASSDNLACSCSESDATNITITECAVFDLKTVNPVKSSSVKHRNPNFSKNITIYMNERECPHAEVIVTHPAQPNIDTGVLEDMTGLEALGRPDATLTRLTATYLPTSTYGSSR
jgi:hypothetical protein